MHGDALAQDVAVADLEGGRLAAELQVLGLHADAGEREEPVLLSEGRRALDHHVRMEHRPRADAHPRPDDAERADDDVRREVRPGIDLGRRVHARRGAHGVSDPPPAGRSTRLDRSCASATRVFST